MNRASFVIGSRVVVRAKDDFYAFIDGWRGTIARFQQGFAVVECMRSDGLKTFFVPPSELAADR